VCGLISAYVNEYFPHSFLCFVTHFLFSLFVEEYKRIDIFYYKEEEYNCVILYRVYYVYFFTINTIDKIEYKWINTNIRKVGF
jgi:hypothetical protein